MKSQLKHRLVLLTLVPAAAFFDGCATEPHYIDSNGKEAVISLSQINAQDWQMMGDKLVADLLASGVLNKLPPTALVAIDVIRNDTQVQADTTLLQNKIRLALSAHGVPLTNAEGLGENAAYANQRRTDDAAVEAFEKGSSQVKTKQKLATITLGGKLSEIRARSDNDRQTSYIFHLSLNDIATGVVLWESEQSLAKKSTRAEFGL